ncbi:MAG: GGDEF domain-containing protein [Acholeplasmatales bacterium]|nr:GGDEF domain-containing protein [Acholeplasmatales bacterium]
MDIIDILREYDDTYMVVDLEMGKVLELYPPVEHINLPCNIISIFRLKKFNLDLRHLKDIETFLRNPDASNTLSINSNNVWYSLELHKIDDGKHLLQLHNLDSAVQQIQKHFSKIQIDSLTKVLQKASMEAYIDDYIKKYPNGCYTMFMMDVDYFKNINDNYGHLFGDKVIVAVANALTKLTGGQGKVGRMGGDEFMIFVEDELDRLGMKNIARLIRYALDNLNIDGRPFSCSTTIGISQYPKNGKDFKDLYTCCDKALYRGKQKGRDCHIIFDPAMHDNMKLLQSLGETQSVSRLSGTSFIGRVLELSLDPSVNEEVIYKEITDYFNLDRISIVSKQNIAVKYAKKGYENIDSYNDINVDYYAHYFTDGMHYINDIKTWELKDYKYFQIFDNAKAVSVIQNIFYDKKENPIAFISYETETRRVWQRGEINDLTIISKIIGTIKKNQFN